MIPGTNSGNDTLILRGSGSGSPTSFVNFEGDDGIDAFQNNAVGFESITFSGGADDDVFQNNASGISNLNFGGDDGADVFENNGNFVSMLTFVGGADDDILVNDGTGVSILNFEGDDGSDLLINTGSDVSLLNFSGDNGKDTLINTGAGVADLIFTGGADDDIMISSGPELSNLNFSGDDGADTLYIRGTGIGSFDLTFNGGADDDIFINDASEVAGLNFNGDDGADGFQNNGFDVASLTFNGGADDDIFISTGSQLAELTFNGGADDDVLQISGIDIGEINFGGDDGADRLFSSGAIEDLIFTGGADDDILQISAGSVGSLNFGGDDGKDTLVNNGAIIDLVFTGGADDDILQNNGLSVTSLTFTGGADNDVLVNNGPFVGTLVFGGDDGSDTMINNGAIIDSLVFGGDDGSDSLRVQAGAIGTLTFTGGADADSFNFNGTSGTQITFDGGTGNDLATWRGAADNFNFLGGDGDDLVFVIGSGTMSLNGQAGDDTVKFVGDPVANVTIEEFYGGTSDFSSDTLDFSAFAGGPVDLDLRINTPQIQSANLTITIADGMGIENTIGTPFADVINGNERNNILAGADFAEGFTGPVAATRTVTQWVLLDFDTHTNTDLRADGSVERGEYVYSQDERNEIAANVENVYRGPDTGAPWFDVRVALNAAEIPAGTEYATIFFNLTPDFGRPGGLASEIDLGNQNLGGSAQVQVNGLLGGVITANDLEPESITGGDGHGHSHGGGHGPGCGCSACLGMYADSLKGGDHAAISDAEIGALKPAASSENFVALSSKIAAHELGHLLGLRHADSFGPIGFGLHDPPGGGSYKPVYTGPTGGFETFDHILGSPASVGSTRFDDLNELFFGEREAVKLTYSFSDPTAVNTPESTTLHASQTTAQPLELTTVAVPNTLSRGLNQSKNFFVQMQGVNGSIAIDPATGRSENDWYSFTGVAGELINIDVMSNSLARFGTAPDDFVDTILRVYNSAGELVPYYGGVAVNDDIFEPTDSSIVDLVLPADDTYYIEVDTFSRPTTDPAYAAAAAFRDELIARRDDTDPSNDLSPAERDALDRIEDSLNDTDIGLYQLFIFRYRDANASDDIDTIKGNGGNDQIDGGPGDSYELVFDAGLNIDGIGTNPAALLEGNGFARTITLTDRGASNWIGSTVDYGDGNGDQTLTATDNGDGTAEFTLNNDYVQDGTYTVTVTIRNDIGQSLVDTFSVVVDNVAPTVAVNNEVVTVQEGSPAENSGTFSDSGLNDVVEVTADFGHIEFDAAARTWSWTYNSTDDLNRTVTITATDDSNASTDVSFTLNVNNAPPLFEAGADETLPTGSGEFSRTNITFTDPGQLDQHTLTVDFGDGSVPQTVDLTTGIRSFELNYTYVSSGTFNVVVTVADGDGGSTQDSFEVTVNLEIFYDFTSATFNTPENGTTNVVLVTRSGATNIASSVEVVLTGLTATAGSDFAADPILLEFAADEITKAVPVTLFNEAVVEDNETIGLSFDNFSLGGRNGVNSTAVLTINNDDSASLNISAPTIIETDGNQTAVFTVTLDNAVQGGFDVAHALSLGTADSNDLLVQTTTPLRFDGLAGETRSIAVQINGENVVEADESFTITLGVVDAASAVQTANITTGAAAQGLIVNDDAAPVANASGPYSIVEGSELELNAGNSTDADDTFAGLTFRWDIDGD